MDLRIEKVNKDKAKDFVQLPYIIYKNDEDFIPHLEVDIESVFNDQKNNFYKNGEIERWLLYKGSELVGRIAAGYQKDEKQGRIGFFECVNDIESAKVLFETAENWLKTKNYSSAQAPVNFGSRDSFWGLMIEGFKRPSYRENYNPRYYRQLIEAAGYLEDFTQTTSEITPATFNIERFSKLASRVLRNDTYEFRHLDFNKVDQFADDFVYIYNEAWKNHDFYKPLTKESLLKDMKSMKPITPETLNWFVYADGEPAGFYINVLDINQVFSKVNGKMNLWGKLKFLMYKSKIDRVRGIVFGVIPAYQNKGLETGMIMKFYEEVMKMKQLKSSELSWIGDFNPKMQSLFNSLGAVTSKVHLTFKKDF
jgi:hypothetical protein